MIFGKMRLATCFLFGVIAFAQAPADIEFFDKEVRPLLRTNCQGCHSVNGLNSGLAVDSLDALRKGGNRGPAAVAGDNNSLFLQAVRHKGGLKMPPGKKLAPEQIAKLEEWVKRGLPATPEFAAAKRRKSTRWAFQPVKRPQAAGIDELIQTKLKEKGLAPSPEADRATLIRRVSLDLIGLPPTPEEVKAFAADQRPDAYERLVDKLLSIVPFRRAAGTALAGSGAVRRLRRLHDRRAARHFPVSRLGDQRIER